MKKYRTKPCEVYALQWTGNNFEDMILFTNGAVKFKVSQGIIKLVIPTLEGDMVARVTDYIIKGLAGEFYPCREDVFNEKYEEEE